MSLHKNYSLEPMCQYYSLPLTRVGNVFIVCVCMSVSVCLFSLLLLLKQLTWKFHFGMEVHFDKFEYLGHWIKVKVKVTMCKMLILLPECQFTFNIINKVNIFSMSTSFQGQIVSVWLSIGKEVGFWLQGILVCLYIWLEDLKHIIFNKRLVSSLLNKCSLSL